MGRLAIFCSASYEIEPRYNEAAKEIVRAAFSKGYTIVSGGAVKGTMGAVADEAAALGATHVGVLPRFMAEFRHPGLSEVIWTDTMSQRKEKMREGADVAVALPGGIGTLDELIETHVLAKLGKFGGRIFVLNLGGFFEPFKALLDHYVKTRMMTEKDKDLVVFCDTVAELAERL